MRVPQYIQYFGMHADLNRGFLHPGGQDATVKLLSLISPMQKQSTILEIGCGVGMTARLVLERFSCSYVGVDASHVMLKRTRSRVSRYADRVSLIECDLRKDNLPLASESVDLIIAESVFAILNPRRTLEECHRLLKRDGMLAWNDRIWGESVSSNDRRAVNEACEKLFGIHVAPEYLASAADWGKLAEIVGFRMLSSEKLQRGHSGPSSLRKLGVADKVVILGRLLTHPKHLWFYCQDRIINHRYMRFWPSTEDWLFSARKK